MQTSFELFITSQKGENIKVTIAASVPFGGFEMYAKDQLQEQNSRMEVKWSGEQAPQKKNFVESHILKKVFEI